MTLAIGLALLPMAVAAHARWFVDERAQPATDWSRLWSLPMLLAVVSGAGVIILLLVLQRMLGDPLWPRPPFLQRLETAAPAILGVQAAVTLIFEASRLHLFVPNIELPRNAFGVTLAAVAVVGAFSFITGVLTRLGALAIIALWLLAFAYAPWEQVIEQVIFVGIAIYLVAVGRGVVRYDRGDTEDRSALTDRLLLPALTILRVTAGISVLVLGLTEKLLNPELGEAFLREYPRFNVARELGLEWFTDYRFVMLVGIVEVISGIALICGILPRLVILALWIPFNLGIAFLPPQELIGHLPILSTMYVLLVRGTEGVPPPEVADEGAPAQRLAELAAPEARATS
jgi:uncharacterized membrane protein YphA (DoxX/SURF4 family)